MTELLRLLWNWYPFPPKEELGSNLLPFVSICPVSYSMHVLFGDSCVSVLCLQCSGQAQFALKNSGPLRMWRSCPVPVSEHELMFWENVSHGVRCSSQFSAQAMF